MGLHKLPLALLRLALRLTGGDYVVLGSNLLQLRVHQPGIADPVAYGEHGHHDPKAQEHDVGCRVNRGGDSQVATQQAVAHNPIRGEVAERHANR